MMNGLNILKKNYSKQSQTLKWVDPNSVKTLSLASSNEQQFILPLNQVIQNLYMFLEMIIYT